MNANAILAAAQAFTENASKAVNALAAATVRQVQLRWYLARKRNVERQQKALKDLEARLVAQLLAAGVETREAAEKAAIVEPGALVAYVTRRAGAVRPKWAEIAERHLGKAMCEQIRQETPPGPDTFTLTVELR